MKRVAIAIITAALLIASCTAEHDSDTRYDEGVSKELALWRAETIDDIDYRLHFDIPEERDEDVTGTVDISFMLERPEELIIDFREPATSIYSLAANGAACDYRVAKEHIIIPATATTAGRNLVTIAFRAGDQSLNRNDDYLYTLLVPDRARTLFPLFDQPDLKASFALSLTLPEAWVAVSNSAVAKSTAAEGRQHISFLPTEPLSSYLFSFVAGRLDMATYSDSRRTIHAYHRETDPRRIAQLDDIFREVVASLDWLEEYTGIAYPFAKYDLVMLPGFQYGGMEHTGATLYNAGQMFLGDNPTLDEVLRRTQLIAHETAHMWFGDYVTMRWFDDVWTKEVFANYFAARMTEPLYPDINHRLNRLKSYTMASLSEDRTAGTTAIRQELDNLRNAGLVYGHIIYNKAPIVMEMIVDIMGEEAFRRGIHDYLTTYAYGNATWPELIAILDSYTPHDLANFSEVWVHSKGMPHISFTREGRRLCVAQNDIYLRGLVWQQRFQCRAILDNGSTTDIEVIINGPEQYYDLPEGVVALLPNSDGRGYGLFIPDSGSMAWIGDNIATISDDTTRESLIITLNECYHQGLVDGRTWLQLLIRTLPKEHNALIASTMCNILTSPMLREATAEDEASLLDIAEHHALPSCRRQLLTTLAHAAMSPEATERLYRIWSEGHHPQLNEMDYISMAWELAVRMPAERDSIIARQRERLTNPDRLRQFDYVARATTADTAALDALFTELCEPENRRTEPWAAKTLALINHPLRAERSVKYIRPGLEELREVQRTGDIFFPRNWAGALLGGHNSREADAEVERFLSDNPDYPTLLRNKILQAAEMMPR